MSKSKNQKAISNLKLRVKEFYQNIELIKKEIETEEELKETLAVANDIEVLISAYEKQIELNKNQNIKIKSQRGLLRVLQEKR